MDFTRLHYFLRIAELGSMTRAADSLRIAQPSLSRQMRLLEAELGVTLFSRHRRGMELTPAGEELRARLIAPLRQISHALNDIRSFTLETGGSMVLGVSPTTVYALAGPLSQRVATSIPNLSLRIVEGYSAQLFDMLAHGNVDIAIVYGSVPAYDMIVKELLVEELMLIGPSNCQLSVSEPIEFEMLAELPLVLPGEPHNLRIVVESAAAKSKIKLNVRMQADSIHLLKELVEAGIGYSILPKAVINREVEVGRLKYTRIQNPVVTRQLALAIHPGNPSLNMVARLESLIREEFGSLVPSGQWGGWLMFDPVDV